MYKFEQNDIFRNTLKVYPQSSFFVNNDKVYYNQFVHASGAFTNSVLHVAQSGNISLYELNVDRPSTSLINSFMTADGTLTAFKTITTSSYLAQTRGATLTQAYPLSSSMASEYITGASAPAVHARVSALKNTLNYYQVMSHHYEYSSSILNRRYDTQDLTMVSIPSIFYGSSIKKGTVNLKTYISGALVGELKDENQNGELIQIAAASSGLGSGSVAGVVLYSEGVLILTGAWHLTTARVSSCPDGPYPQWNYFGAFGTSTCDSPPVQPVLSHELNFKGTNYIQTSTFLAHADRGELNHSNNPTYIKYGETLSPTESSGSKFFIENDSVEIKNVVSSSYADPTGSFEKITYISKIGLYDEHKNLVAIAKVANPVKKTNERDFTFKIKFDI
jgi:hypothetical protein